MTELKEEASVRGLVSILALLSGPKPKPLVLTVLTTPKKKNVK